MLQIVNLEPKYFGEGMTILNNEVRDVLGMAAGHMIPVLGVYAFTSDDGVPCNNGVPVTHQ